MLNVSLTIQHIALARKYVTSFDAFRNTARFSIPERHRWRTWQSGRNASRSFCKGSFGSYPLDAPLEKTAPEAPTTAFSFRVSMFSRGGSIRYANAFGGQSATRSLFDQRRRQARAFMCAGARNEAAGRKPATAQSGIAENSHQRKRCLRAFVSVSRCLHGPTAAWNRTGRQLTPCRPPPWRSTLSWPCCA
jgi:hypothetical protein